MADTDTNPCKPLPCGSQQEIVEPVAPMLFTLGIIFSPNLEHVYLIRRDNPDSQKGKLNGVGGKVEPGESLDACMAREAVEESGYSGLWTHFAIKEGHTREWGARMNATCIIQSCRRAAPSPIPPKSSPSSALLPKMPPCSGSI